MALPIASIPVLTGEVGRQFEAQAAENYKRYLDRTPGEVEAAKVALAQNLARLETILKKAKLKG